MCPIGTTCMKCQILFSGKEIGVTLHEMSNPVSLGKIRQNITNLLSTDSNELIC